MRRITNCLLACSTLAVAVPTLGGAPGDVDTSFYPGTFSWDNSVEAIALQSDGRILIGGLFSWVRWELHPGLVRLNPDGTIDETFLHNMAGPAVERRPVAVYSIAVQDDGKILFNGDFTSVNGIPITNYARLNPDGSLDDSFRCFSPRPNFGLIRLQPDGKILLTGAWGSLGGANLARMNPDGSLDPSFVAQVVNSWQHVDTLGLQSDGKMVVAGPTTNSGVAIAKLDVDGSCVGIFHCLIGSDEPWITVAVQPDDKILVGGDFYSVNNVAQTNVARLNNDGSLDTSFVYRAEHGQLPVVECIAVQPDGKIILGGGGNGCNLARLAPEGTLDSSFACCTDGTVYHLALQTDGKILLSGQFTAINGVSGHDHLARIFGTDNRPTIVRPAVSQTAEAGSAAYFSVGLTGPAPFHCQWFFNGTNALEWETNPTVKIFGVQTVQAGAYTVVVTNYAGAVTSSPAMLSVVAPVARRPVPALRLDTVVRGPAHLEHRSAFDATSSWLALDTVQLNNPPQFYFDMTSPSSTQEFYRAWQQGPLPPSLSLDVHTIPAITLTGSIGASVKLDYINQFGPIDAWMTLATVTLTNTTQLYFDTSNIGRPPRLYRVVPLP